MIFPSLQLEPNHHQVAQLLVDHFDAPALETIHQSDFHLAIHSTLAYTDDMTPLVKYVYYPALYDCDDYKHSTTWQ